MSELTDELMKPQYHLTSKEISDDRWKAGARIAELEAEVADKELLLRREVQFHHPEVNYPHKEADVQCRIHSLEAALNFGIRVLDEFKGTGLRSAGEGLCMCDAEICTVHDLLREFQAALAKHEPTGEPSAPRETALYLDGEDTGVRIPVEQPKKGEG